MVDFNKVKELVEAVKENNSIIFMHKVKVGPTDQSYGINVASLAKIPLKITLRANDILTKLESKTTTLI